MRQPLRRQAGRLVLGTRRWQRVQKWALLTALLPSLTFMGHWTPHVDIPGTNLYIGFPEPNVAQSHSGTSSAGHDHRSHCHADASSCTDVPFTGGSAFGLLAETAAFLGGALALGAAVVLAWRPAGSVAVGPDLRPPRGGMPRASSAAGA